MRRPSYVFNQRSTLGVTMTPMIDVVFLLLVFFVWTASFQVVERSLPSRLLAAAGSGAVGEIDPELADFDRVVVRLHWRDDSPAWEINGRPITGLAELGEQLALIVSLKTSAPLLIDSGPNVPLGHVIDVYDLARIQGFAKVQFAATDG